MKSSDKLRKYYKSHDELHEYYKENIKMMHMQVELMQEGRLKTFSFEGTKQIDETDYWIKEYKRRIDELEDIIARYYTN